MLRIKHSTVALGLIASTILGGNFVGSTSAAAKDASLSAHAANVTPAEYRKFREQIAEISKLRLDNPKNVDRARHLLINHDERALSHGWVANCGDVAAGDSEFANGVKKAARRQGGARKLAAKLEKQPSYVFEIPGWKNAARDVMASISQDSAAMQSLSFRLSEVAYGRTSKEADYARQAQAKANGVTGATRSSRASVKTVSPMMTQILALGAVMAVSKEEGAKMPPAATMLVSDKDNDQCLRWSDLNLRQCLAAARDNSERAYCLGEEGVGSRADCWSKAVRPAS